MSRSAAVADEQVTLLRAGLRRAGSGRSYSYDIESVMQGVPVAVVRASALLPACSPCSMTGCRTLWAAAAIATLGAVLAACTAVGLFHSRGLYRTVGGSVPIPKVVAAETFSHEVPYVPQDANAAAGFNGDLSGGTSDGFVGGWSYNQGGAEQQATTDSWSSASGSRAASAFGDEHSLPTQEASPSIGSADLTPPEVASEPTEAPEDNLEAPPPTTVPARGSESKEGCRDAVKDDECWKEIQWALKVGIYTNPDWYSGLSSASSEREFQAKLRTWDPEKCPEPCDSPQRSGPASLIGDAEDEAVGSQPSAGGAAAAAAAAGGEIDSSFLRDASRPEPAEPTGEAAPQGPGWPEGRAKPQGPSLGAESAGSAAALEAGVAQQPAATPGAPEGEPSSQVPQEQAAQPASPTPALQQPVVMCKDPMIMSGTRCICPPPTMPAQDNSGDCLPDSQPMLMTFYMYRAQSQANYSMQNVNMADLAGVMWYLHNEIVCATPRKYDVTRILRYKATMKTTAEWWNNTPGHQFGPFSAYDSAKCTADGCDSFLKQFGYMVGCQVLDPLQFNYVPFPETIPLCKDQPDLAACAAGTWYSLPGACPSKDLQGKDEACKVAQPGGACKSADVLGSHTCSYYLEPAGQVSLDELEGLSSYSEFWLSPNAKGDRLPNGNVEWDRNSDKGKGMSFWDDRHNLDRNAGRMKSVQALFQRKYPDLPADLPQPPCL